MWGVEGLLVSPAAAVLEAFQEAVVPLVPLVWEWAAEVALADQGTAHPPLFAVPVPDRPASHSHRHGSLNPSTTTIPRALMGPTDQQVCGHPAISPSHLTLVQRVPQMENC